VHLGPHNCNGPVDSENLGSEAEHLVRALPFLVPHPLDRIQAGDGLLIRGLEVGGVGGEDPGKFLGAGRPPCGLIVCEPLAHPRAVGHLAMLPGKNPPGQAGRPHVRCAQAAPVGCRCGCSEFRK
jgi:hypothetical protein